MSTWWLVLMSRSRRGSATTELGNSGYQSTGERLEVRIARRDEITDTIDAEPAAPPTTTIDAIRSYLGHILAEGTSAERKAPIEPLIAEIRITNERIIPVFKIPGPDLAPPGDAPATGTTEEAVRAMLQSVGRVGLEPTAKGL